MGAGGTARAIIASLCLLPERPDSIRIYNHHKQKADQLIHDFDQSFELSHVYSVETVNDLNIEIADLLINTTPLGMDQEDPCPVVAGRLHAKLMVYDVIYNPPETKLVKEAQKKGARTSNGLGMLYYQGILAFQHWANTQLDNNVKQKIRETLNQGLNV